MLLFAASATVSLACSRPSTEAAPSASVAPKPSSVVSASPVSSATSPLIAARPYSGLVPRSYDASKPTPLVLVVHGYGGTGRWQAEYMGMNALAETKGFLVAFPDGTPDHEQKRFWNATDACCDFDRRGPDDVAYLGAVLDDMMARYNVDKKRVYVTGLSNGGFMSHRLACDLSPRIAAIVSLAGAQWKDDAKCAPTSPVSIVEAHEDGDTVVRYGGGTVHDRANFGSFPAATQTVATWAKKNGCTGALAQSGSAKLDLNAGVGGPDTTIARYEGCPAGVAVELWTIRGGAHVPRLEPAWAENVWAFFASHPKP